MATLKPALPRGESELGRNRDAKGDKSYYYAHNEGWEVPENAKVRSGEGLVTGGSPVKLGPDGKPLDSAVAGNLLDAQEEVVIELRRRVEDLERQLIQARSGTKPISQFSFSDEGAKCKVYVEVGPDALERRSTNEGGGSVMSEASVAVIFSGRSCTVRVSLPGPDGTSSERSA
ncbi:unnamed protein product, partial [Polarella glacialis]